MTILTTTHLNFHGDARAALEFYHSVFGGRITMSTYGDFGMPLDARGAHSVVFGQVDSDEGFRVMAYDIPGESAGSTSARGWTRREHGLTVTNQPFFVAVSGATLDETQSFWDKLSDGASIVEPLAASAWSAGFGMLTDRFGVTWSVSVTTPSSAD